ncbi:MAG: radical SAM protein [Spirochaetota bacterium]
MMMAADTLRLVFWELTKRCNLRCAHCRAEADDSLFSGELDTAAALRVVDDIAAFANPILVLTGGEPLYRADLFEIARHAVSKGLRIALATNGTLIDADIARAIREAGFGRVSISIDGSGAASHDGFRGIPGSFDLALEGARLLREEGVEFQFNTTITRRNVDEIEGVLRLAEERGAKALHVFMLVPVGCWRGDRRERHALEGEIRGGAHLAVSPNQGRALRVQGDLRPALLPALLRQEARKEGRTVSFETDGMAAMTRGCLAGSGVCFISHRGDVQPCGYLPLVAGSVVEKPLGDIWGKF